MEVGVDKVLHLTVREALIAGQNLLKQVALPTAALDARLLLEHTLALKREALIACEISRMLTQEEWQRYEQLLLRRHNKEPVAQLLGEKEFWGMSFKVTEDTLTPRPDTEILIETVLELLSNKEKPYKFLELGVGTGCIILTLLHLFPQAKAVGVDLSKEALSVTWQNAQKLALEKNLSLTLQYWALQIEDQFDLVITNPPYISSNEMEKLPREVLHYDPWLALCGGKDGLESYHYIARSLPKLLKKDGLAILECGMNQEKSLSLLLAFYGIETLAIVEDYAGIKRCLVACKTLQ